MYCRIIDAPEKSQPQHLPMSLPEKFSNLLLRLSRLDYLANRLLFIYFPSPDDFAHDPPVIDYLSASVFLSEPMVQR